MTMTRVIDILRELMNAKSPRTSEYLANVIKVTSRTIRNDIKDLNDLLLKHGAEIKPVRGAGYELVIQDEKLFSSLLEEVFQDETIRKGVTPTTPEERVRHIITRLLVSNQFIKLEDLADEIYVSKPTILNDIRDVKEILKKYGIELQKRPGYGLKAVGDEVKLRFCMSEYVFNRKNSGINMISDRIPLLTQDEIIVIRSIILSQIKEHDITLSDVGLNNLIIHIAIACKRIRSKNYVSLVPEDLDHIVKQKEYEVAKRIVEKVEENIDVQFPEEETAYISIHLLGTKMIVDPVDGKKTPYYIDEKMKALVNEIVKLIDTDMNLGISEDSELIEALCLHLKPAINRFRYGMNLRNPMLNEIKANYPLAFEAGIRAGTILKKKLGIEIDENEIGYLALHIGVSIERNKVNDKPKRCIIVCASGIGSAKLLYYKLQSAFGSKLEIVGTTEYYKLQQYPLEELDFIVTTVPISEDLPLPVIHVNTFLGTNDLEKIENTILKSRKNKFEYTREELVFLDQNFETKEEVITFLCDQIEAHGLVQGDEYKQSVFEREALSPTCFGNLVAIPHPLEPKTDQTFWAICTLQKPIQWADKRVQFICLLNVKKNSTDDLQKMYNLLVKVVDDIDLVQQLIKCKTYKEMLTIFLKQT